MKDSEEETVDNVEILNFFFKEIKILIEEVKDKIDSNKDSKIDYADEIEKLEQALLNFISENDLKILKLKFADNKWKYLNKKVANRDEISSTLDGYQKLVDNSQKEDFFGKI